MRNRIISVVIPILTTLVISWIYVSINNQVVHRSSAASSLSPPGSIASNCSTDVTSSLNAWFASLPAGSVVNLPANGCYLVSNSQNSVFILQHTSNLVINGNGTTLKQTSYDGNNAVQPVLTLGNNTGLTINNMTMFGPASNSGAGNEGDYGIKMYQNNGVNLNGITITNVDGDGLALLGLGNQPGVNWNVVVNGSTIENVGYHGITPEAADGFTFENSTLSSGNIDAEVDFSCQPPNIPLSECGTFSNPSVGVVNMTYSNDSFPNGFVLLDGMSCMPVGNWSVENNNFGSAGMDLQFDTTYSLSLSALQACGQQTGLTIKNNTSTNTSVHPCCGSGSPFILLQGWKNVSITNNNIVFDKSIVAAGNVVMDMWSDTNVSITNNNFINTYTLTQANAPSNWPANSGITNCGNTLGEIGALVKQPACPVAPPPGGTSPSNPGPPSSSSSKTQTTLNQNASTSSPLASGSKSSANRSGHSSQSNANTSQNNSPASSTSGSIPVISSAQKSLKKLDAKPSGKIIIYTSIAILALGAAIISLKIWTREWDPIERLRITINNLNPNRHRLAVVGAPVIMNASGHSKQTNKSLENNLWLQPELKQKYAPGEVIKPEDKEL